jgi:hypothetical protein
MVGCFFDISFLALRVILMASGQIAIVGWFSLH